MVQKGIGCIPEGRKVFPNMTVGDNLRVGSYLVKEKRSKRKISKVFKLFPKLKERVSQIASGMSEESKQCFNWKGYDAKTKNFDN